ncbi:hypothetical protein ACLOJK_009349 [Asimina triloba]
MTHGCQTHHCRQQSPITPMLDLAVHAYQQDVAVNAHEATSSTPPSMRHRTTMVAMPARPTPSAQEPVVVRLPATTQRLLHQLPSRLAHQQLPSRQAANSITPKQAKPTSQRHGSFPCATPSSDASLQDPAVSGTNRRRQQHLQIRPSSLICDRRAPRSRPRSVRPAGSPSTPKQLQPFASSITPTSSRPPAPNPATIARRSSRPSSLFHEHIINVHGGHAVQQQWRTNQPSTPSTISSMRPDHGQQRPHMMAHRSPKPSVPSSIQVDDRPLHAASSFAKARARSSRPSKTHHQDP